MMTALITVLLICVAFQRVDRAAGKTVWDGVYSPAQAERGKETYTKECLRCHGANLEGAEGNGGGLSQSAVALSGEHFAQNWYSSSINDLFNKISKTMPAQPPTRTGHLAEGEVLDLLAYILSFNGFPAGAELVYQPELAVIDIVGKEGPEPPQPGQTARAIGCLTAGDSPNVWLLSMATLPLKSKSTGLSSGPELDRANETALGDHTIRLLNARPGAGVTVGAKIEAKGRYVKMGDEDRISVLSFQVLSSSCS